MREVVSVVKRIGSEAESPAFFRTVFFGLML